ncbi:MAG: hypothetical protein ACU83V_11110 [Gammaproteobacteria bacterium]
MLDSEPSNPDGLAEEIVRIIQAHARVDAIYLYGSRAKHWTS